MIMCSTLYFAATTTTKFTFAIKLISIGFRVAMRRNATRRRIGKRRFLLEPEKQYVNLPCVYVSTLRCLYMCVSAYVHGITTPY